MPKIVWNWCLKFILSRVLQRWEDWHAVNLKVFSPSKRKGLLQYTVYNEVSAFNSEVGLLWESVYWLKMTTGQVVETSVTVNWNCEQSYSGLHSLLTIILNLLIKKCLLFTLMGVRIKQVGFRENGRALPR